MKQDSAANAFCTALSDMAQQALLYEVSVTPKPGLVDRAGSGAHKDMDYTTFVRSAAALKSYFGKCAAAALAFRRERPEAQPAELLPRLRPLGLEAEQAMYAATEGVNTHKGAIFTLGLLSAAAGLAFESDGFELLFPPVLPKEKASECADPNISSLLCRLAGVIASPALEDFDSRSASGTETAGEQLHRRHGVGGIRAEAAAGFPSLTDIALPALELARAKGLSENDAGLYALLMLITQVEDTTMMKRCGSSDLRGLQAQAAAALEFAWEENRFLPAVEALDRDWSARGISAGGCADLLAAARFLELLQEQKNPPAAYCRA